MKNIFKILIIIMLGLSVIGCELFDPKGWSRASQYRKERGRKCYRKYNGNVYCKDTK